MSVSLARTVTVLVEGLPKGQPRPRAFAFKGKARVFDPGTAEGWKQQIAVAFAGRLEEPFLGPVLLEIDFMFPRPKHHAKRTPAPSWFTSKPDTDNLAKAVMDALTQLRAWEDDSQVCVLMVRKRYANAPAVAGARVTITTLEELA
jgi:Holliday junction resolvase RusA-like endonuclease